jgi:hypothetical protein
MQMPSDPKQVVLVVIPTVALSIALLITLIVILVKMRRRSQREILPTSQNSAPAASVVQPPTFTERHIANLRGWQKPADSASTINSTPTSINNAYPTIKTDPSHHAFQLSQPPAAQQKPQKGSYAAFMENRAQRALANENVQPLGEWHHKPKGPAYWREVGKEMEARRTVWEKMKERVGIESTLGHFCIRKVLSPCTYSV